MDLLALSGSLVPVAAAEKAVETWVARRQFGGVEDGQFSALMGTVGRGGRIWQFYCRMEARMSIVGEGAHGERVGSKRGGRKVVTTDGGHRDLGVVGTQQCWFVDAFLFCKKVW